MPFIQARAKYTNGDGRVVTGASNNLNVVLPVSTPPTGQLGDWDYGDLTVEYRAGYPGRSCSFMFVSNTGEIARATDIVVNDPNGVVTVTNHTVNKGVKITSNNKSGLISIRVPARFVNFQCWDDTGQVNGVGYPALKGFRSFGNTLTHILLPIVAYNFEVPTNLPPTLKSIKFGLGIAAAVLFNDPKVSNWDVSNLLASSFDGMFAYCIEFNQNLSGWCVSQVTSTPIDFSYRAALTAANHPVWGTCPVATGNTTVFHKNVQWGPPNQAQWRVESYVYFGNFVINGVTLNFTAYGWNAFNLQNYINISATTYEQAIAGINYIKQFNVGIMRLNIDGVITDFEFNPKLIDRSYPSGDDRYYRAYITNINVWNFTTDKHGKSGVTTLSLLPSKVVINGGQVKTEYSEWVNSGTIRSGILGIGPVVYAGVNYQNYYSVFTLSSTILYFVPTSPARSESENYNKIRLTITYSATRKLVMEYNYYRIWNNNRQYQWTGGNNLAFDALMRQYIDEVGELKLEFYN